MPACRFQKNGRQIRGDELTGSSNELAGSSNELAGRAKSNELAGSAKSDERSGTANSNELEGCSSGLKAGRVKELSSVAPQLSLSKDRSKSEAGSV